MSENSSLSGYATFTHANLLKLIQQADAARDEYCRGINDALQLQFLANRNLILRKGSRKERARVLSVQEAARVPYERFDVIQDTWCRWGWGNFYDETKQPVYDLWSNKCQEIYGRFRSDLLVVNEWRRLHRSLLAVPTAEPVLISLEIFGSLARYSKLVNPYEKGLGQEA